MQIPRGYRNNNPGNIEDGPFTRGLPGYAGSDGRFARFNTLDEGTNAQSELLRVYSQKHGLNSINGVINRWAPTSDGNNVSAYASHVGKQMGLDPNAQLDMNDPNVRSAMARAMAVHENGGPPPGGSQPLSAAAPQQFAQAPQQGAGPQQIMQGNEPPPMRYGLGRALVGAGSAIAGISSPAQAAALARLQEGMEDGSPQFATVFDPYTGTMVRINKKTGEIVSAPATAQSKAAAAATKVAAPEKMSATALKTVAERMESAGVLHDVNTASEKIKHLLDSKTLDLGLLNNIEAGILNRASMSNEQSRAYTDFQQYIETMRNGILQLAKGPQTDPDAVRAMNQIVAAGANNDNKAMRSAINNLMRENKKAVERGSAFLAPYASKYKGDDAIAPLVASQQSRLDWYKDKNLDDDKEEISAAKPGAGGGYKVLKVHPQR